MVEMIVFVNKNGEGFIIETNNDDHYYMDEFEFNVEANTTIDKSILNIDGYGVPTRINIEKALKPLKFYKITWAECVSDTPDGYDSVDVTYGFEEIDYINQ